MTDIRSYFSLAAKKPLSASIAASPTAAPSAPPKRKAKALVISSDEEDEAAKNSFKPNLKKLKKTKSPVKSPLGKLVDASSVFGSQPIKRIERPKTNRSLSRKEVDALFGDDVDDLALETSIIEEEKKGTLTEDKSVLIKSTKIESQTDDKDVHLKHKINASANGHSIKPDPDESLKVKSAATPSRKRTASKTPDDSITDEDRQERKRAAMILYEQFKNRSGPLNPGSKELPKGKPTCLINLTFVISGVLDSLERDEAAELIRQHGGKVTTSISKKTSFMVVGLEAGLKKLAKADELKVKQISEDDLLNLIREKSGLKKLEAESPKKELDVSPKKEARSTKKEVKLSPKKEPKTPPKKVSSIIPKHEVKSSEKSPNKHNIKLETLSTPPKAIKKEIISPKRSVKTERGTNAWHEKSQDIVTHRKETAHELNIASIENQAWVDKYKPTSVKQIIGQQGPASNVAKLTNWLTKWYINQNGPKKPAKPNPWAKNDDGAFYKAALLSGPPGVGKTTSATLVSKELGFDVVEFNASDTRSKRLLKEEVSELLSNKSLYGYFNGSADAVTVKHVLIMDEVDGMAGNEDRGGIQELIALIKESSVPIICMCNDRNHQKMRSLVNHCYDLRFARPNLTQIKGSMMSMCFKEGVKLAPSVVEEVIAATNNDIRQTINHLTLLSANKSIPSGEGGADKTTQQHTAHKDMKMGPYDVVRKVFSAEEHKKMTLYDKCDLFFHDYSLGPLFVQQNYLHVAPNVAKKDVPMHVAMAADSLSLGDLVEQRIRSQMAWSMLPTQGMFSSVLPGEYMSGTFTGQIAFPGWLGKNSKSNKRKRLAQEIHDHTRVRTSGSRQSVRMDYAPFLLDKIVRPLKVHGVDGVAEALAVIKEYHLLREDLDSLIELTTWPGKKSLFDSVDGKVKAALTRAYNKEVNPYSYSVASTIKKSKGVATDDAYGDEDEDAASSDDEQESGVDNDVLIKAKKRQATVAASSSKTKTSTKPAAAGSSRGKVKGK